MDVILFRWKEIPVTALHNIVLFLLLAPACYERAWTDGNREKKFERDDRSYRDECLQERERERERRKIGVMEHHYN